MNDTIKLFQKEASQLGRDKNSIEELKLWLDAGKGHLTAPDGLNNKFSRKPATLEDVRQLDISDLSPAEQGEIGGFLDNLEVHDIMDVIKDPDDNLLDEFMHPMDTYFILTAGDERAFLINTSGHEYARYWVEIPYEWVHQG